jgi:hypothetical protein
MNPIALIEVTAVARSAVLGALATDPVVRTTGTAATRPKWRSASRGVPRSQRRFAADNLAAGRRGFGC